MVVDRYDINLIQHPGKISSEVEIWGVALNRAAEFTFCLNPALVVSEVAEGDQPLNFKRDHQILQIDFGRELAAGDSVSFKPVSYTHLDVYKRQYRACITEGNGGRP